MKYDEWLERYRKAWIERDADLAGSLFTEDAIYREQPFQKPFVGRDAIRQYWDAVTRTQTRSSSPTAHLYLLGTASRWNGGPTC